MTLRPPTASTGPTALSLLGLVLAGWACPNESPAQLPEVAFVAQVGCGVCEGIEAFGSIQGLHVDARGLVVLDRDPPMIRLFGPDGGPVEGLGRRGEGPGELALPIAVHRGDEEISVVDMRLLRLTRIGRDRETETHRLGLFPAAARFSPGGDQVYLSSTDFRGSHALVRWMPGASAPDTLLRFQAGPADPWTFFSFGVSHRGEVAAGAGRSELYEILWLNRRGDTVRVTRRPGPPPQRTEREMEAVRERIRRGAGRRSAEGGGAPGEIEVSPHRPHFYDLAFDEVGRLWALTGRGRPGAQGHSIFDVFGPDGEYLGEVRVEGWVEEFDIGGRRLAGRTTDELGVQKVGLWTVR